MVNLILLGFSFVALPLVISLLFTANKLSYLAQQSSETIFEVASLTQLNTKLSDSLSNIERSASQYLVLNDDELHQLFIKQQQELSQIIKKTLKQNPNKTLAQLLSQVLTASIQIKSQLSSDNLSNISLEQLQQEFKKLVILKAEIKHYSNSLIKQKADDVQRSNEKARSNIFNSLYIIPVSLLIALLFLVIIIRPLKRLISRIQTLEQGNFQNEITFSGAAEFEGIAHALEMMRVRLHSLELQKSSFIRHISHELKTPLAAIKEGTELIYDNSVGPLNSEQQEICDIIKMSAHRLQCLIEDLLDFNIVLDSTSLVASENITLSPLLSEVINERQLDIKRKNLTIITPDNDIQLHSNATQLKVVFDNILSNAIKYSPQSGTITLLSRYQENDVEIAVIDEGIGISFEHQDKVFDAFYQGTPPEHSQIKGSGLGLTIVKELLSRLQGTIQFVNREIGAEVTIKLPNASPTYKK
ncbi:HAMP domain-containing sensor histidine kinase [Litorilituus lipolyticus]|uniref:histidine kinase n=1 Tax=Litorilituus lipolyticus TaxID=2491017 RepID=A0A502KYK0_9GAMM|nr:HAMP domain-containing sensor histidine kinase [Litorilituus lipolyticus]TPH15021.1 HAMP domain-containing protein [Litorilituus lipolyticus]